MRAGVGLQDLLDRLDCADVRHHNVHRHDVRTEFVGTARWPAAATLLQYNSVTDLVGVKLRIHDDVCEGTDDWLVSDEGINAVRGIEGAAVRRPVSEGRAVRVTFTYTLAIRQRSSNVTRVCRHARP